MAKKISNEQFIDSDFLKPAIDRVKELINVIDDLQGTLKKVGAESEKALSGLNPAENVKDSIKLNETLERLAKTEERLAKLEEEKAKSLKTLKTLQDNKNKQEKEALDIAIKTSKVKQEAQKQLIAENKVTQQNLRTAILQRKERERQFKNLEAERKAKKKQLTAYQIESRRLTELRNKYKDLAVAEKANTKEAKELLKEVVALDKKLKDLDETVGQNQRSVGDYKKAVEGLKESIKTGFKSGPLLAVGAAFAAIGAAFGDTREGALALQIQLSKVTEIVKVFVQSLINSGPAIGEVFSAIGDSFSSVFVGAEIKYNKFLKTIAEGKVFLGIEGAEEELKKLNDELTVLEKTYTELEKSSVSDSIDKVTKAFEGNLETTSKAIEEQEKFLRLQLATTIAISEQEKALAGLAEERQILQDISDDDTLSFIERKKFIDLANEAAVKFAALENKLALEKEKLTIQAIKQDLRRAKALSESRIQAIQTGEQLQEILKNEAVARKVSDANDEAFTAAFIERVDKEVEVKAFQRDQEEKQRITRRDSFEQEIDIITELGEKTIAVNQKVINDQTKTLAQRQAALVKNNEQEKKIFKETVERIKKQGIESLKNREIDENFTEAQRAKRIELIKTADINAILNEQDQVKALESIRQIQLGEGEERVLKDLLKTKKDIAAQNEADAEALKKEAAKTLELQDEIAIQEKKLKNDKFDIDKAQRDNQKENLKERIDLLEEDSVKRLELEKEYNNLLLDEQQERIDKETKAEEDKAKKRQELYEALGQVFENFLAKQNEKNLKALDDQISAIEERQNSLRTLAENGNEEAVKSLAESEKKEVEIRREKEKELQRQQRIEAGLAAFQLLASKAKENPETALPETLKEILTLSTFVNALPGFYDGTENIGQSMGGPHLNTSKDAYLSYVDGIGMARLDGGERIVPSAMNKAIGGLSNEELTQLAIDSKRGVKDLGGSFVSINNDNVKLEGLMRQTNYLLKRLPSKMGKSYDTFDNKTGVLTQVVEYANKRERTHKKILFKTRK